MGRLGRFFLFFLAVTDFRSSLNAYVIVIPRKITSKVNEDKGSMLYAIKIEGKDRIIHLEKQEFLPRDFTVNTYTHEGELRSNKPRITNDCYYQGYIVDIPSSVVTLRTCSGIRGLLELMNDSYIIEPLESSPGFEHLLYKMDDVYNDNINKDFLVLTENDTEGDNQQMENKTLSFLEFTQARKPILQEHRCLELYVVVTKELYLSVGSSSSSVITSLMQMVSYINTRFSPFNIVILLTEVEIWTNENKIPVTIADPIKQLDAFLDWVSKNIALARNYDTVLLIHPGTTANPGVVNFGSVCSRYHGGLIMFPENMKIEKFSLLVTHMLGHVLGISHDNHRVCNCPEPWCIMNTDVMKHYGAQFFSSCSSQDIKAFLNNKQVNCLLNCPPLLKQYHTPKCGNKLVDEGEQCDCGTRAECWKNPCCEFGTCMLKGAANCASGECCTNCKVIASSKLCRPAVSECDLPEFCDLKNPTCGLDIHKQNGSPCSNKGYCYNGLCQTHDAQCNTIFGPGSKSADVSCYIEANSLGDRSGNCGGLSDNYAKCDSGYDHTLCGEIQCVHTSNAPTFAVKGAIIYYRPKNVICKSVDFLHSKDLVDHTWVNDGTKCGNDKICLTQKCVHIQTLQLSCDPKLNCNGHGVCNSIGKCHCDAGWSLPSCHSRESTRRSNEHFV
ncbi:disintegrin and metalloproteinase domain-containing protein 9-like [Microcaecilia unicolor]|uniref:Disintegrin and metalloproteinase domain-containing protein 9-like n=1 Tax=Microcaecilia unicolor TaxID=1415580 RepID=A0A6P7Y0N2_9AMPH|nr:disintegrin and metalloproteinase domain-containing protein 9-like [Microcaecilia unicolor]